MALAVRRDQLIAAGRTNVNMASCCKRHTEIRYSRRRLAALSFLSNISLDGTHQDTKTGRLKSCSLNKENGATKGKDEPHDSTGGTENCPTQSASCTSVPQDVIRLGPGTCRLPASDNVDDLIHAQHTAAPKREGGVHSGDDLKAKHQACSHRERSATVAGNWSSTHQSQHCTPLQALNTMVHPDKHCTKVSADNLEQSGLLIPVAPRSRKISSNTSEGSHSPTGSGFREKEVRFVNSVKDLSNPLTDQRLVLVTGPNYCSPIMIFSTLPFSKSNRLNRSDFRGDSGRRRQASGQRPLSSIDDYPDLYAMLGLPKPEEGQALSCFILIFL